MAEWQPIETAPKDGTWIVICDGRHAGCFLAAYWDGDEEAPYKWFTVDGSYHADFPTHWMPLPEPPA